MKGSKSQGTLFELPREQLPAAPIDPEHVALAERLPPSVRLGGMSWAYPGWRGLVYATQANPKRLAADGLPAYATHPLYSAVEIDRSFYEPLPEPELRRFFDQVPAHFRFLVKAHQECSLQRFPKHARYGRKSGESNARYLDPHYAAEAVVGPIAAALGPKLGGILFQFPPEPVRAPDAFASDLGEFLARLPKGVPYAVELRSPGLLTSAYASALVSSGAVHCHNVWGAMPSLLAQARALPPPTRRPLLIRWLFRPGDDYQKAEARFAPFDRLREEDGVNRGTIAQLVCKAAQSGVESLVLVDNKAEGCAPESIHRLAAAIAAASETSGP